MASTDDLWFAFAQQVRQIASPTFDPTNAQFSFGSTALQIDLGNPDPLVAAGVIYQLGNTIPAKSPDYIAGSNLITAYNVFLSSIDLKGNPNPNLDPLINAATSKFNAAQTNFNSVLSAALAQYTVYKAAFPNVSFADFVAQDYPTYGQAATALTSAQSALNQLMTQKYGPGAVAVQNAQNIAGPTNGAADPLSPNKFNMQAKIGNGALPGSTPVLPGSPGTPASDNFNTLYVPLFELGGFTGVWPTWQQGSVSGTIGQKITLTSNVGDSNWSDMGWAEQSTSVVDAFFFDMVSTSQSSGSTQTSAEFQDQWTMEIDFVGLGAFELSAPWFNSGLIDLYKNQLVPNAPNLFSAGGALARVPEIAVIGFQPTVKMTLSNRDYNTYKSSAQSSSASGFGIGPFFVSTNSNSSYSTMSDVNWNDNAATVTINPPATTVPLLLGVISTRYDV